MCKPKKRIRRLAALSLCLMMLVSTDLLASAAGYKYMFRFSIDAGGEKKSVAAQNKTNYNPYASISFNMCYNSSGFSLPFRLRSGTNHTAASGLYYLNGVGDRFPSYDSGYGQYDKPYYFRIQTDSSSTLGATVEGSWRP